jgi:hypothetical protein
MCQNLQVPLTSNVKVDTYLDHYCEVTLGSHKYAFDFDHFKRIAFPAGVPSIILDALLYLTGAYHNKTLETMCKDALKMLYERAKPQKVRQPRKVVVPPYKDVPEPLYSKESSDSDDDDPAVIHNFSRQIAEIQRKISKRSYLCFEAAYKTLS